VAMLCVFILLISANAFARPVQQNSNPTPEEVSEMKKKAAEAKGIGNSPSPLTALQAALRGTFWRNPEWVMTLNLSADQQKKMDEVFLQYRLKLIDLPASLQKEELILEPLWTGGRPSQES